MDKKCGFCGNKGYSRKNVQYIYRHGDNMMIMNNVPCEECDFCGEQYFEAGALKKIEKAFFDIHQSGKKAAKEISVPVEEFA